MFFYFLIDVIKRIQVRYLLSVSNNKEREKNYYCCFSEDSLIILCNEILILMSIDMSQRF